jgi:hypothetical protein
MPDGWGENQYREFTGHPEGPTGASAGVLNALDCFRKMMPDTIINLIVERTNYFISTPRFKPRRTLRRVGEDLSPVTQVDIWKFFACRILSAIHNKVIILTNYSLI